MFLGKDYSETFIETRSKYEMSDKGLNLFDEFAAECVHLYPQEE